MRSSYGKSLNELNGTIAIFPNGTKAKAALNCEPKNQPATSSIYPSSSLSSKSPPVALTIKSATKAGIAKPNKYVINNWAVPLPPGLNPKSLNNFLYCVAFKFAIILK